jgi:transcriptional regulator with XRE-family HTH domain
MPNLKTRRADHGLTQGDLAALPGIRRQQTIAEWERGVARPRLRQQRALGAVLNVTSAELRDAFAAAARQARRQDQHHA